MLMAGKAGSMMRLSAGFGMGIRGQNSQKEEQFQIGTGKPFKEIQDAGYRIEQNKPARFGSSSYVLHLVSCITKSIPHIVPNTSTMY